MNLGACKRDSRPKLEWSNWAMKQCRAQELFWAMLYLDTEKCKQGRFLVPKVSDKCREMVLSALSRARLYSDEARRGESVAAARQ